MTTGNDTDINLEETAMQYVDAYERFHMLYANYRFLGWDGDMRKMPTGLQEANHKMIYAMNRLYQVVKGKPRPNFVAAAQRDRGIQNDHQKRH